MTKLETNLYAKHDPASQPIFNLSRVQYSPPGEIIDLQVNNNILVMAIRPMGLVMIDLQRADEVIRVDVPKSSNGDEQCIDKIFADPTGRHLVITIFSGDGYYLSTANLGSITSNAPRKPRLLRLRHPISAIAWPPRSPSGAGSSECLIGSPQGAVSTLLLPPSDDLFNLKSVSLSKTTEKDHTTLFTLSEGVAITGIGYGYWKLGQGQRRVWVVLTTKERMYELSAGTGQGTSLVGKGGWGEEVFRPYRDSPPSGLRLGGCEVWS